jgi:hypothetical protein
MAGSEENFAEMMTERAREIGLRNPSSRTRPVLPAEGQVVTMRELATLAQHIWRDRIPSSTAVCSAARIHLEQDPAAQPQSAAADEHRRGRSQDGFHRRVGLCDRRFGSDRDGKSAVRGD